MKPIFVTHESYQDLVLTQLREYYSNGRLTLVSNDWPIITKLWITDISYLQSIFDEKDYPFFIEFAIFYF